MSERPSRIKVWWLFNEQADTAILRTGAPQYLRDQLGSRRGRNGRGRLWVDERFGKPIVVRLERDGIVADAIPGGIVIADEDERYCIGGHVYTETVRYDSDSALD